MPAAPAPVLAALALAGALVGVGVSTSGAPSEPTVTPVSAELRERPHATQDGATQDGATQAGAAEDVASIPIACGGYDEHGEVVTEEATRIDRAPVDAAGVPRIPAVCGGYTADGTFIGDD
ncbi:MAG: hypothetical protein KY461_00105 [Actinobacteria bacterium]|nr:hypothetical protein [Actinomycetota bacterium]